ncbi:acyltransferase family protein [Rhizohabitans arisaemae]|uniref:acyltransferase family protein n=1 Tax=Rhizohabitans arisaemae TaxID=2720610 RepID=UPI0024B1FF87|nr:acyltransferase family protein [Rhizohabitans arisaemae]
MQPRSHAPAPPLGQKHEPPPGQGSAPVPAARTAQGEDRVAAAQPAMPPGLYTLPPEPAASGPPVRTPTVQETPDPGSGYGQSPATPVPPGRSTAPQTGAILQTPATRDIPDTPGSGYGQSPAAPVPPGRSTAPQTGAILQAPTTRDLPDITGTSGSGYGQSPATPVPPPGRSTAPQTGAILQAPTTRDLPDNPATPESGYRQSAPAPVPHATPPGPAEPTTPGSDPGRPLPQTGIWAAIPPAPPTAPADSDERPDPLGAGYGPSQAPPVPRPGDAVAPEGDPGGPLPETGLLAAVPPVQHTLPPGHRFDLRGLRPAAQETLPPRRARGGLAVPAEPEAAVASPATPAKRVREPYLDNVKFVAIALVVAGHALWDTTNGVAGRATYLFIYTFHMPLFVIISGYLSRNFWTSSAKTNRLFDTLVIPYVVVEAGYGLLRLALDGKWSLSIADPAWLNWYLLALLFWRLSSPVWQRLRYPMAAALICCVVAGLAELPGTLSIDRFFGLLPFFVLGLILRPHHFELLHQKRARIAGAALLAAGFIAAVVLVALRPKISLGPIYFRESYADLGRGPFIGVAMKLVVLTAGAALAFAVLAVVPRRATWFSDLGTRTLYVYVLHGIPVLVLRDLGVLDLKVFQHPLGVASVVCGSVAVAIVLSLPQVRVGARWLLEPRLNWAFRKPQGSKPG